MQNQTTTQAPRSPEERTPSSLNGIKQGDAASLSEQGFVIAFNGDSLTITYRENYAVTENDDPLALELEVSFDDVESMLNVRIYEVMGSERCATLEFASTGHQMNAQADKTIKSLYPNLEPERQALYFNPAPATEKQVVEAWGRLRTKLWILGNYLVANQASMDPIKAVI